MSQIKPASGPAFVGKTQGNTPNLFWRRISFDQLRSQSQYVGLPPPDQLHLECIADYRNVRQESQLWTELHQGLLTTGRLNAALGFYEPAAAKRLGVATRGDGGIRMAWGSTQEASALFSVMHLFPDSQLEEVGLCWVDPTSQIPAEWGFQAGDLPPLGAEVREVASHGKAKRLYRLSDPGPYSRVPCHFVPQLQMEMLASGANSALVVSRSATKGVRVFRMQRHAVVPVMVIMTLACIQLGILPSSANQCIFGNVYVGSNLPSELSFVASMRAVYTVLAQQQAFDTTAMRWAKKEKLQIDSSGWKCYIRLDATDHPIDYSSLGVLAKKRRKGN
ncbi:hypothetical protein WJX82_001954 [Trebouxia sp. C0006]